MGFESCHPAVNFIFFAAALYGTVRFNHPVFLAIAYVCAFAYSVKRCGKRAVAFNLCLLPLILIFALYYSSYHHFGVTVLRQNFIGNNLTVESFVYGLVIGLRFAALCMWLEAIFRIVTSDGSARSCRFSLRSCCGSSPELAGRRGKSTSLRKASAGAAIRGMFSSDSSTAYGYSLC